MRALLLIAGLAISAVSPGALAQQPAKQPPKLPLPTVIRTLPPIKPVTTEPKKPEPKPAPEHATATAAPLEIPFRMTTAPIEVVGSKAVPTPLAEFTPVRLTTTAIQVTGSAALPTPISEFSPVRLTTSPIEVAGTEESPR